MEQKTCYKLKKSFLDFCVDYNNRKNIAPAQYLKNLPNKITAFKLYEDNYNKVMTNIFNSTV